MVRKIRGAGSLIVFRNQPRVFFASALLAAAMLASAAAVYLAGLRPSAGVEVAEDARRDNGAPQTRIDLQSEDVVSDARPDDAEAAGPSEIKDALQEATEHEPASAPDSSGANRAAVNANVPVSAVAPSAPGPAAPDARPSASAPWRDCEACPWMISLPAGRFDMGDLSGAGSDDERPVHSVDVQAFAIGRYEVTLAEWKVCAAEGQCRKLAQGGTGLPAVGLSRSDALSFASWLSKKTGRAYRLPSEAEWEYAAKAATRGDYSFSGEVDALCLYANGADASSRYEWRNTECSDGAGNGPSIVGSFRPNAFGLHDMIGNVWEWTADCWHSGYKGAPASGAPWEGGCDEAAFVLRGGSYSVDPNKLRVAYRYFFPDEAMPFFGLRVASNQ